MALYTSFVITPDGDGGFLEVKGVNPSFGVWIFVSPAARTQFQVLDYTAPDTFRIEIKYVPSNIRFNFEEMENVTPVLQLAGLQVTQVTHNQKNPVHG